MAFGATAKSRIAYIAESAFGTTPATPTFQTLRRTSGGLRMNKTTKRSEEINNDRNVRAEYFLGHDAEGSIDFEFSDATLEDFLQAALGGTWSTDVLKVGNTERWFTFEETIDVGGTNNYLRFLGCSIDTLSLSLAARQEVRGSVGIMGRQASAAATSIISGATYTAANTEAVETAKDVAVSSFFGLGSVPLIKSISLNIANNLRRREAVGTLYSGEFGQDQVDITGSIECYFEDGSVLDELISHTADELEFTIGATTGKKLTVNFPNAQLMNGAANLGGRSEDVMVTMDFRGLYDATAASSIVVTRNVT